VNIDSGNYSQSVAYVSDVCPKFFRGDTEANARLIAAAPDLLAFVESLVDEHGPQINESIILTLAYALIRKATVKDSSQ
jgi:hypothetical protein